jgi:hypothetical protein
MTTQGIQLWTVPISGYYTIRAAGAEGGSCYDFGGRGAIVEGSYYLTRNTVVSILVGQMGVSGRNCGGGGWYFCNI